MSDAVAAAPGARASHLLPLAARADRRWPVRVTIVLLAGYLAIGKGFAYTGTPPVFIGEVFLVLLLVASVRGSAAMPSGAAPRVAAALLAAGALHAGHDLLFGPDAAIEIARGMAIVYYMAFALIVHAQLVHAEEASSFERTIQRVRAALDRAVFVMIPLLTVHALQLTGITLISFTWPRSGIPLFLTKSTDMSVGLAFLLPLIVDRLRTGLTRWRVMIVLWIAIAALASARQRGALIAVAIAVLATFGVRLRTFVRTIAVLGVTFLLLLVSGIRINAGHRELSARGISDSVVGIFAPDRVASANFANTTEWRTAWWKGIWRDTLKDETWLSGPGWGTNLATKYLTVDTSDTSAITDTDRFITLRYPHNTFMSLLGRVGMLIALLFLWVWFITLVGSRASQVPPGDEHVPLLRALQGGLVASLAVGLTDVYLESPQGAIPFWMMCGALWWFGRPRDQKVTLPQEPGAVGGEGSG